MNWAMLTDAELIRLAHLQQDTLTSTVVERELLKRFEAAMDDLAYADKVEDVFNETNLSRTCAEDIAFARNALAFAAQYDTDSASSVLDTLKAFDLDPADLKAQLEIADQIHRIRDDATSDGIAALSKIFNPTTVTT